MPTRDVIFNLIGRDGASPAFAKAAASAEGAASRINRAGERMAAAGTKLTHGVTLPLLALGAASVKAATDFNASMTRIQTQAGASAKDVQYLTKAVLDMKNVQYGPNQLAEALYHLKSVGLENVAAMKALRQAQDLAAVGGADLEETTNALAGAWRTGIKGAKDFHNAAATVNAVIGAGNMRLEDFNAALGTGILPSAKTFGLTLKDVGSALAVFTDESVPADAAATRLRMSFSLLGAPSSAADKQLSEIGLTGTRLAKDMRRPDGLINAIGDLRQHLKDSGMTAVEQSQLLSRAFGGGRSSSAILSLVNNYDVLLQKQEQVTASLGRYDKAVKTQQQTPEAQFKERIAALEKAGVILGTDLLPAAVETVQMITSLVDGFNNLTPAARGTVIEFAKWAIIVGPALSIGGRLVKMFVTLGGAAKTAALFMSAPYRTTAEQAQVAALKTEYANAQIAADEALTAATVAKAEAQKALAAEDAAVRIALAAEEEGAALAGLATTAAESAIEFNAAMQAQALAAKKAAVETAAAAEAAQLKLSESMLTTRRSAFALQSAITGVGIGLTAGLFTRGASDATKVLTSLGAAAAGAAFGFSMGGPLGAAVGGLGAGLTSLATQFFHLGGSASHASLVAQRGLEQQKTAAEALLSTLKAVNGAYGKQTRVTVANLLQTTPVSDGGPDLLQAATQLGINPGRLTKAVLGNTAIMDNIHRRLFQVATGSGPNAGMAEDVINAFDSVTIGAADAERAFERYNQAIGHGLVTQKQLDKGAQALAKELRGTGTALDASAFGIRNTKIIQANVDWIDHGTASDLKHGKAVRDVAAAYETQVAALSDTLHQLHFNDQAVQDIITTYSHVPKKVLTYIEKHGTDVGDIQAIIDKLHQIPRHVHTDYLLTLSGIASPPHGHTIAPPNTVGGLVGASDDGHARGGFISGRGSGTSDSIPAWLSNGEYVITAAATARHRPLLDAINGGPGRDGHGFAAGGMAHGTRSEKAQFVLPLASAREIGRAIAEGTQATVTAELAYRGID